MTALRVPVVTAATDQPLEWLPGRTEPLSREARALLAALRGRGQAIPRRQLEEADLTAMCELLDMGYVRKVTAFQLTSWGQG